LFKILMGSGGSKPGPLEKYLQTDHGRFVQNVIDYNATPAGQKWQKTWLKEYQPLFLNALETNSFKENALVRFYRGSAKLSNVVRVGVFIFEKDGKNWDCLWYGSANKELGVYTLLDNILTADRETNICTYARAKFLKENSAQADVFQAKWASCMGNVARFFDT